MKRLCVPLLSVLLVTPVSAQTPVSGLTTISATATDNVGVVRVEFRIDGNVIATDTSEPYSTNWDTTSVANGTYLVSAHAFDAAGNEGSANVNVGVTNVDVTPPTVTIQIIVNNP